MKQKRLWNRRGSEFVFVLALAAVFILCAFLVVTVGIGVYRSTVQDMEDTYSVRTAFSYVTEKIRRHDALGRIRLTTQEDSAILIFIDETGEERIETYLYTRGDDLCELSLREGSDFDPSLGEKILTVKDFRIRLQKDGFLELSAKDSRGNPVSCLIHPRCADLTDTA